MADLVAEIRKTNPTAPLTLIGHSSGGGFALRIAGSPIQNLFAPDRAAGAPIRLRRAEQPSNSGGWAIRIFRASIALSVPARLGLRGGIAAAIAFAVPPNSSQS